MIQYSRIPSSLDSTTPVAASQVGTRYADLQAALDDAATTKRVLIIDTDLTVSSDLLVNTPVHVNLPVGVTITVAETPTLLHYAETESGDRHAGIFSLWGNAAWSVFDFWGTVVGPTDAGTNTTIYPVLEAGLSDRVHYLGQPRFQNVPGGICTVRSVNHVPQNWSPVLGPSGPWVNPAPPAE